MTNIFICYGVQDKYIRNSVIQSLSRYAKTCWTHDRNVQKGFDYERAIEMGIENANNFFYFISPHSVVSEYCQRELEPNTMPGMLQKIHWIDFNATAFEKSFSELIQAIELDREHVHQRTVLQQRASDWAENLRSADFLLNITACANAESWQKIALAEEK